MVEGGEDGKIVTKIILKRENLTINVKLFENMKLLPRR